MKTAFSSPPVSALELFCGIGGCAAALGSDSSVAAAIDINREAIDVYRENFSHNSLVATIESIPVETMRSWNADLWWMSPPCQPFTRRGYGADVDDLRSQGFLAILDRVLGLRPTHLAMENVPEFADSRACELLHQLLNRLGYEFLEITLCPTEIGIPNRRRRFYLVASRQSLKPVPRSSQAMTPLSAYLDHEPARKLWVDPSLQSRYPHALNIVDPAEIGAVSACFTSAYGRSPVRSGSYLQTDSGLRRFSPTEILRLLGFPDEFRLPPELPLSTAWRLAGNSLSIPAVRSVLSVFPWFAALQVPTSESRLAHA